MPYFSWQGITLHGAKQSGTTFARSSQELDHYLIKRDIALVRSTLARGPLYKPPVKLEQKIELLRTIAMLLKAGILLPETITIVSQQLHSPRVRQMLDTIATDVSAGLTLSQALQRYPHQFDQLTRQMIYIGHESGSLATALEMVSNHMEMVNNFKKQLRNAALMPCITLLFFVLVCLTILMGIIPRFQTMFANFQQELPAITRYLVWASQLVRSSEFVMVMVVGGFLCVVLRYLYAVGYGRQRVDAGLLRMPIFGQLWQQQTTIYYVRSLSLLLAQGMPLPAALKIARSTITNSALAHQAWCIEQEVISGVSLHEAMIPYPNLCAPELITLVHVGQESGHLSSMLERVAVIYQERMQRSLKVMTTLLQPLMMIVLGLLIAGLIFAVYLPVLQLAQVMR